MSTRESNIYCKMCHKPTKHFDISADPNSYHQWKCSLCGEYNEVSQVSVAMERIEAQITQRSERIAGFIDAIDKNRADVHFCNLMEKGRQSSSDEMLGLQIALEILRQVETMKDVEVTR